MVLAVAGVATWDRFAQVIFLSGVESVALKGWGGKSPSSPEPEPDRALSEYEEVVAMRVLRLLDGGFTLDDASAIGSRLDLDYHNALELVAAGCPPELAARIVL